MQNSYNTLVTGFVLQGHGTVIPVWMYAQYKAPADVVIWSKYLVRSLTSASFTKQLRCGLIQSVSVIKPNINRVQHYSQNLCYFILENVLL